MTSKERGYVERWFSLGLDEKLIFLACEQAVENRKVSFAYADKILSSLEDERDRDRQGCGGGPFRGLGAPRATQKVGADGAQLMLIWTSCTPCCTGRRTIRRGPIWDTQGNLPEGAAGAR
ncbi:MAG: DnaD domain protein [Anaerotruncus massiliensis (ex Togo et al. 2019)]